MPVTIGYQPVGAVGAAAILAGQGQYHRYLQELTQRWNLAQSQMQNQRDMQAASLAAEAQRQQAQFGQQSKLADSEFGQRKELLGLGQQHDLAKMSAQHGYRGDEMRMEGDIAKDRLKQSLENSESLYDYQLSAADKHKMDKIDTAIAYVNDSPDYTDEERAYALSQLQAQKANVNPKAVPINLQDHYTKNSITLPDGSVVYRDPNGQIHDFKPTKNSTTEDKFNDPRVLNGIMRDVEREVMSDPNFDPATNSDAYEAEVDRRMQRRVNSLKKTAGRTVADDGGEGRFDKQMIARSHGASQNPDSNPDSMSPPAPAAPVADDPIAKAYPPDVAAQIHAEADAALAELAMAKQSGDPRAIAAAKAKGAAILQKYSPPPDSGQPSVAPPSAPAAPIIPPPPTPKARNTMSVRGKTVSKER